MLFGIVSGHRSAERRAWLSTIAGLAAAGSMLWWGVLGGGVLGGGGPRWAGAANTAGEYLVDSDGDSVGDRRPFVGRDRYGTALALARRFAANNGGLAAVSTAIVVSGESPIDAAAVAGLARVEEAPVLLVAPSGLPRGVADFLEDHDTQRIMVVGGPAAVPESVVAELAALASAPEVIRVAGANRYATAAAVARLIGGGATWCTSNDPAAVVLSGEERDAMTAAVAGPLVFALGLPVVLTRPSELPEEAASFLDDHDIDHAVVVGGADAVSEAVESQLGHAGVSTVTRIGGADAARTAAQVADVMGGVCSFAAAYPVDAVALVGSDAAVDGLTAAPLLGGGLEGAGAMPLLVADEPLPGQTSGWLSRTPTEIDGRRTHLRVVAIGAVSEGAMAKAVSSAATAGPFTATIEARAGHSQFTITTSDALHTPTPAEQAAALELQRNAADLLWVNDLPAFVAPTRGVDVVPGEPCVEPRRFTVTLRHPLRAGDVIELRPTDVRFGARGDRRLFSPARFVVPEPVRDTTAPTVEIVAPAGSSTLLLVASDDSDDAVMEVRPRSVSVLSSRGVRVAGPALVSGFELPLLGATAFEFPLTAPEGYERPLPGGGSEAVPAGGPYRLEPGDRVSVRSGAVADAAANRSRRRVDAVSEPARSLRVVSVIVSDVRAEPGGDAAENADSSDGSPDAAVVLADQLRISARPDGSAAGALGNRWSVNTSRDSTFDPAAESFSVKIAVSERDRAISIRFASGTPSVGQLADALNAHSGFSGLFTATEASPEGICVGRAEPVDLEHADMDGDNPLTGGTSEFRFDVGFSHPVRTYLSDDPARVDQDAVYDVIDDILADLLDGYGTAEQVLASEDCPGDCITFDAPTPYARLSFTYATTDAGRAAELSASRLDTVSISARIMRGYIADDPATSDIDESLNVASQVRPRRS